MPAPRISLESEIRTIAEEYAATDENRSIVVSSAGPDAIRIGIRDRELRPLASVLKVALAATLFDLAHAGKVDLDESTSISGLEPTEFPSVKGPPALSARALRHHAGAQRQSVCGLLA